LAGIVGCLNLKDHQSSTLLIGIGDLLRFHLTFEHKIAQENFVLKQREKDLRESISTGTILKNIQTQSEQTKQKQEATLITLSKTISYLENKKKEYDQTICNLKIELEKSGYLERLSHQSLVELHQQYTTIQTEIQPKERLIQSYKDLPPDITRATLKVEETRATLAKIEQQMRETLDQLNL
jgi:hypothetical protein